MQPRQLSMFRFRKRKETAEKKERDYTLEFSKFFPYGVPLLIMFGVARLYFYYNYFNINIISFLDFAEIITSFLDVLLILFGFISIFFGGVIYFVVERKKLVSKSSFIKLIFFLTILVSILTFFSRYLHVMSYVSLVMLYITIMLWIVTWAIGRHDEVDKIEQEALKLIVKSVAVALGVIVMGMEAYSDAQIVKKQKRYLGVTLTFNDSTKLVSDSNTYYIGKTNNYIFIYNQKQNVTTVRKVAETRSIDFPPKMH